MPLNLNTYAKLFNYAKIYLVADGDEQMVEIKKFLYLFFALFFFSACPKKNIEPIPTPTEAPPVFQALCAPTAWQVGQNQGSINFGGRARTYELHLPKSYDGKNRIPAVISFHGGGGQGKDQRDLTHFEAVGADAGFVTVYPDGVEKSWNSAHDSANYAEINNIDDVGFARALIDELHGKYCIDPKKIYVSGFSNGSSFSHRLGCELSDKIAALAPISGPLPTTIQPECRPKRKIPILVMHGKTDPRSPYMGGSTTSGHKNLSVDATVSFWMQVNGCQTPANKIEYFDSLLDGTNVVQTTYSSCLEGTQVVLFTIEGGGHTWPMGFQYLPVSIIGVTSQEINATSIIWNFFKNFSLN